IAKGRPLNLPCVDINDTALVLLPGESYIEYQLAAQSMRPDAFVCVAGYGDAATGYVPTDQHWKDGDTNLTDWCWVAPGAESVLLAAMAKAMRAHPVAL